MNCQTPSSPSFLQTPIALNPLSAKSLMSFSCSSLMSSALCARSIITCGAPFEANRTCPSVLLTSFASVRLSVGLNGKKLLTSYSFNFIAPFSCFSAATLIQESIASGSPSLLAARAPIRITSSADTPPTVVGTSTVSSFRVNVPVLSEHKMSIPASSSTAVILVTIACFFASSLTPDAIVTDKTTGMAIGIPPMMTTNRMLIPAL
mmetsp:Transcript_13855/g.16804  ORF Transcript_13855/g.16804 Transcript_13855/m.16804 type:complete len:206 (+) Transcript_13855:178-795(+)